MFVVLDRGPVSSPIVGHSGMKAALGTRVIQ
jgi:hypothetical protein